MPELKYSPVFGNRNQKKEEEKKEKKGEEKMQPRDVSSGTGSGQLQDTDNDPLQESRSRKRESGESHSGRSTPEQKQPRVQAGATGNVQTNEVMLL